jgi:hypothetical protein
MVFVVCYKYFDFLNVFFSCFRQCCGTVMIYCSSGSGFGSENISSLKKNRYKILPFSCQKQPYFQTVELSVLIFNFFILFYVGFGYKSGSRTGTVMHSGSGSAKAKSYSSCWGSSSSSTTLFPQ